MPIRSTSMAAWTDLLSRGNWRLGGLSLTSASLYDGALGGRGGWSCE